MNEHIEEMQVTIKVLRVGTKQFSRSLFNQLPIKYPCDEDIDNIWGYIQPVSNNPYIRYVLWAKNNVLYTCKISNFSPSEKLLANIVHKGQIFIGV